MKRLKLRVIIVSYNHEETLERAIRSILTQVSNHEISLTVVDNNSKDNSYKIASDLQKTGLKFELIENSENTGFTGGNNLVFDKYLGETDYFYLHNPDAYFTHDDSLNNLLEIGESFDGKSLIQAVVRDPEGNISTAGNELFYLGFSFMNSQEPDRKDVTTPINSASGAALLISSTILKKTGKFDDKLFAYIEDSEFSARAQLTGFECRRANNIDVFHSYDFSRYGSYKLFLIERNRFYFIATFYDRFSLFFLLPAILYSLICGAGFVILKGGLKPLIQVYKFVFKNWRQIMSSRGDIEKFASRESFLRVYSKFNGRLRLYENNILMKLIVIISNIFFETWWRLYLFFYKNLISKIVFNSSNSSDMEVQS